MCGLLPHGSGIRHYISKSFLFLSISSIEYWANRLSGPWCCWVLDSCALSTGAMMKRPTLWRLIWYLWMYGLLISLQMYVDDVNFEMILHLLLSLSRGGLVQLTGIGSPVFNSIFWRFFLTFEMIKKGWWRGATTNMETSKWKWVSLFPLPHVHCLTAWQQYLEEWSAKIQVFAAMIGGGGG